ncbi:MAG: protein kinase domain-containing protein, partial [Parachlamydiaceae bacterium]
AEEWKLINREVRAQRAFAKVSSLCCPIPFAFMKPSRKKNFLRCVCLIEKGFDRSLNTCLLPPLELHYAFIKIAKAIQTAHFNGFIFSDLKEDNVLYSKNGELAITDLGGGFYEGSAPSSIHTYSYTSPEAFLGSYGKKHDIFSFFILIYRKSIRYDSPEQRVDLKRKTLKPEAFVRLYVQEILKFRKTIPLACPYRSLLLDMSRPNPACRPAIDSILKRLNQLTPIIRTIQTRTDQASRPHLQAIQKR